MPVDLLCAPYRIADRQTQRRAESPDIGKIPGLFPPNKSSEFVCQNVFGTVQPSENRMIANIANSRAYVVDHFYFEREFISRQHCAHKVLLSQYHFRLPVTQAPERINSTVRPFAEMSVEVNKQIQIAGEAVVKIAA